MDKMHEPDELAIVGPETADHTVSVEVLTRALAGLQRIVYLMAASAQDQPIGNRFTPSDALRSRNTLRCGIPRASSFAVPLQIERPEPMLFPQPEPDPLSEALRVFQLTSEGGWSRLNQLFSRPEYMNRVLSELREMLPKSGERWGIRLRVGGGIAILDHTSSRSLGVYLSSASAEDAMMTVTGELLRVYVESHRLVIRYPPTRAEIRCQCEPSVFGTVMRNYDVPIQVTGLYTLDRKGHPKSLTGVTRVEPIDLSPMTFSRMTWVERTLAIKPALTLLPEMDEETGQFYILKHPELGIDVFARTREELSDELAEQLLFQWDTYAQESPDRLSRGARQLREALLTRMWEVELATQSESR
jgi:hypothetical protein